MNKPEIKHRRTGLQFLPDGKAEIWLWAPYATEAAVKLHEEPVIIQLEKAERGWYNLITDRIKPGDNYWFRLNNATALPDPASLFQAFGIEGPSQAFDVSAFKWTDSNWQNPETKDYIIYELHTGTFTNVGSLEAIEEKLDYLVELGITAVELMPVAQFPGERNWGYDGVFPFSVQNTYGGPAALQHLVNACHEKGLAVILDTVYNHFGFEGNILPQFGPYLTEKYKTPWGPAINFDDRQCDEVRHFFIENMLMWLRDFHIDALRLDAADCIFDLSPKHILLELREFADLLSAETGRRYWLMAETDLNDVRIINPVEQGGHSLDVQWLDNFHHTLRVSSGLEKNSYFADYEGVNHLAKSYTEAFVYDGIYSNCRMRSHGASAGNSRGDRFVVFSQNHDQVGNLMLSKRSGALNSFRLLKLISAAVLCAPYIPLLFMGEEYGEINPFYFFSDHQDPEARKAAWQNRKNDFMAMGPKAMPPDPSDERTFKRSRLNWNQIEEEPHITLLNWYKTLIQLRKSVPALRDLNRLAVSTQHNTEEQTLTLRRNHETGSVLILMNFSEKPRAMNLPRDIKACSKLICSSDTDWRGPTENQDFPIPGDAVIVRPESVYICRELI
ncbi:MAG: malto-oligosyltrehalose trehalohydrolase [Bacteroidota bacterium]